MMTKSDSLQIDLSDLEIDDIEVLAQEGSRGMPEFAASCCGTVTCGSGSCGSEQPELPGSGTSRVVD